MKSLKTAVIVLVLMLVLYGVYRVLSMPEFAPRATNDDPGPAPVEIGTPVDPSALGGSQYASTHAAPAGSQHPGRSMISPDALRLTPNQTFDAGSHSHNPYAHDSGQSSQTAYEAGGVHVSPYGTNQVTITDQEIDARAAADAAHELERAFEAAEELIADGDFREALATLSRHYDRPGLSSDANDKLVAWLDALAGKVIYSTEHFVAPPHEVKIGETLKSIGEQYSVPPELIYNINRHQIPDPRLPQPGTLLKVIRGPFRADVNLEEQKLTLFLDELYAGHFIIDVGDNPAPLPGRYHVKSIPPGQLVIDLGSEMSIHSSRATSIHGGSRNCIVLGPSDAADVCSILSNGSRIEIRR